MASLFQPVADATRVFLNSAMGGLPEIVITDAGRAQVERNRVANAAARERLGLMGSALDAAGYAAGFIAPAAGTLKALSGLKYLPTLAKATGTGAKAVVKAAPAVERAVARKVVPGYAARETALKRMAAPYLATGTPAFEATMPTISGAAGRAIAAHPVRTAAGASYLGVGTAVSHNTHTYDAQHMPQLQQSMAVQQPRAAPAITTQPVTRERLLDAYDNAHPEWRGAQAAEVAQPTLQDALAAAAMSGKVSTRQLLAMGEFADRLQPRGSNRPPTPQQVAMDQAMAYIDAQLHNSIQAGMDPAEAQKAWYNERLRLLKVQPSLEDYIQDSE